MTPEDIAAMPIATMFVDFHFVRSNGKQFQCDDPNSIDNDYAPTYVEQILSTSNDYFTNPEPNLLSPVPIVALIELLRNN